jgi:tRNA pseudouridine32 synthase / 23S rRNA pseudouridine746 synthase
MHLADRILFMDGEAMIIDKPQGLPVDPPRNGALSLENHIEGLKFGFKRWPTARNPKAHTRFQKMFEAKRVIKHYLAVIEGITDASSGVIDLPLGKFSTEQSGWRMIVDHDRGKASITHWEKLAEHEGRALIRFIPETGRTHQIRAHAIYGLRAAIVGDPVYGKGAEAMLLHSSFLSVPREGKPPAEAKAPIPERFAVAGFVIEDND